MNSSHDNNSNTGNDNPVKSRKNVKFSHRYSVQSLKVIDIKTGQAQQDPRGRLFFTGPTMEDLTPVKLLHSGIDTIRQLYTGIPRPELLQQLQQAIDAEHKHFELNGYLFAISKMGKASGYRYKLQNNALGLILLYGWYYAELDKAGTHLKIEVSPHLIAKRRLNLTIFLHRFAKQSLQRGCYPSAVSLHLACDFQGWTPAANFLDKFVTRTRTIRQFFGIQSAEFNLSEVAAVYGKQETFTFGKADALQVCLYRKDIEAEKHDKIDYWRQVWGDKYTPDRPVWRLEVRFHHQVLKELANDLNQEPMTTAFAWRNWLQDIWAYALDNNRLECQKNHMAPIWQLLRDDAFAITNCVMPMKRKKKTANPAVGRNIANMLGNMISLYARQCKTANNLLTMLKKLHIWPLMEEYYYKQRGLTPDDLRDRIHESMCQRYLIGKAA